MSTIAEIFEKENRRSTSANTEKLLLDLYELAITSTYLEEYDQIHRANLFNEIRELISLKRKMETAKSEFVNELATAN